MVSLRDAMDRLFEDAFTRPLNVFDGWQTPRVDMVETDEALTVKATLPGIKPEDLEISISGDILTIRGEAKAEDEVAEGAYHLRERYFGSVSRSLHLPTAVNSDEATAEFADGILTLTIPKAEEVRPRLIQVKAR
jgi:HSP20 family protein